mmetsp:Transcript_40305/g.84221  ORF Transcript_40305/g.84221 Transcript_40305/m.84221 type:complete len:130 (+) Transcript_40305:1397-1786(+)
MLSPPSSDEIFFSERGVFASSMPIFINHIVLARASISAGWLREHVATYTCAPTTPKTAALDPMIGVYCQARSSTACWAFERVNHASLQEYGTHCHDHRFRPSATLFDHSRSNQWQIIRHPATDRNCEPT